MKTQPVSNQNFTAGKIKFVRNFKIDCPDNELKDLLEFQMKDILPELKKLIKNKPYDLFISRAKNMNGFYTVNANTEHANIVNANKIKCGKTSIVYSGRLERFISAAAEAMKSFENAKDYEELIKPEGFFKTIWKILFNKH